MNTYLVPVPERINKKKPANYLFFKKKLDSGDVAVCKITWHVLLLTHIDLLKFRLTLIMNYDVASGSEKTSCNKIDKPLVVYRYTGNRCEAHNVSYAT